MEGVLALMIPVLALATGFVAVLKRPWGQQPGQGRELGPAPETAALAEEVAQLREELARVRERVDFTERLLDAKPAPRLASAEQAGPPASRAHS